MVDPSVLQFGNRTGAYVALLLFGCVFAVLGVGVWHEVRRHHPRWNRMALTLGILLFAGPTTLIYASSLSGFYEVEVRDGRLVLHYLHPTTTEVRFADIAGIRSDTGTDH